MDIHIQMGMSEYNNVVGKKLYGCAFGACSKGGAYLARSFIATVPNIESLEKDLEERLYKIYPIEEGWTNHWKTYQMATPQEINEAFAGLLLPNEEKDENE